MAGNRTHRKQPNKDKRISPKPEKQENQKTMGGVCTAVKNNLKPYTVKVKEGSDEDEYLVTRLDHIRPAINVVNVYGGQESRMDKQGS